MSACSGWAGLGSGFGEVGVGWGTPAHTHARPALHTCLPPSKRTRSRVTDGVGCWGGVGVGVGSGVGHLLTRARAALHSRLPPKKRTRSRAPAQHCVHACYLAHARSRRDRRGGVLGRGGRGWGGTEVNRTGDNGTQHFLCSYDRKARKHAAVNAPVPSCA